MIHTWERVSVAIGDLLLGWVTSQNQECGLVLLVAFSAAGVGLSRRLLIRPARLREIVSDETRLRKLIGEARKADDFDAAGRYRQIRRRVATKKLRAEILWLCVSVVWLSMLMNWGAARLEFEAIGSATLVLARIELAVSSENDLVVLTPAPGLSSESGWIQRSRVDEESLDNLPYAEWILQLEETMRAPIRLSWSLGEDEYLHLLDPSPLSSTERRIQHNPLVATSLSTPPYCPFGVVPGIAFLGIAPWLLAYSIGTLAALFGPRLLRRCLPNFYELPTSSR